MSAEKNVGGTDFLFKWDATAQKLPVLNDSLFHQRVLSYWKLLEINNLSPRSKTTENHAYEKKTKWLHSKEWMDKGVWSVIALVDSDGTHRVVQKCFRYDLKSFATKADPVLG